MLAGLKARIPPTRREWLRSAARGNPFRHERPREPVRIGELVSPLRYDVLCRVRHFEFATAHRELFDDDFESYERLAREEPYFVWFERVMVPSWRSDLIGDPEGFERAWRERLRKSIDLFDSFQASGFDESQPIEVLAGVSVQPTPTGKRLARRLYAGDGNHRLALLMLAGQEELAPSQYVVKRYRSFAPSDTTSLLLARTGAHWEDYEAFIALGYPTATLRRVEGRVVVDAPDLALAAEVETVVAADLRHLPGVPA